MHKSVNIKHRFEQSIYQIKIPVNPNITQPLKQSATARFAIKVKALVMVSRWVKIATNVMIFPNTVQDPNIALPAWENDGSSLNCFSVTVSFNDKSVLFSIIILNLSPQKRSVSFNPK